jgi:hypothetical protein
MPGRADRRIPKVGHRGCASGRSNNSTGKSDNSPPFTHVAPPTRTGSNTYGMADDARAARATGNSVGVDAIGDEIPRDSDQPTSRQVAGRHHQRPGELVGLLARTQIAKSPQTEITEQTGKQPFEIRPRYAPSDVTATVPRR